MSALLCICWVFIGGSSMWVCLVCWVFIGGNCKCVGCLPETVPDQSVFSMFMFCCAHSGGGSCLRATVCVLPGGSRCFRMLACEW